MVCRALLANARTGAWTDHDAVRYEMETDEVGIVTVN
jgi:hypothetical protein